MDIPIYVPNEYVIFLQRRCGSDHPKIRAIVCDLRLKEGWAKLVASDADPRSILDFLTAVIEADANYDYLRDFRKQFLEKCAAISKASRHLSDLLKQSDTEFSSDGNFMEYLALTGLRELLFHAKPQFEASKSTLPHRTKKDYLDTWSSVRYWLCDQIYTNAAVWDDAVSQLSKVRNPRYDEVAFEEIPQKSMNFISEAWDFAPQLPDILDRLTEITSGSYLADSDDEIRIESALRSRRKSQKRDYLRTLWHKLFVHEWHFVIRFVDRKTELLRLVADFSTVVLELSENDSVSEADARQTLTQVMPLIERDSVELADYRRRNRGEDYVDPCSEIIGAFKS